MTNPQVEAAKIARDQAQSEVERLSTLQSELSAAISQAADAAREGNSAGASRIPALAEEKGATDGQLKQAEATLTHAEEELAKVQEVERAQQFDAGIEELRGLRVQFAADHKSLCMLLGKISALQERTAKLRAPLQITGESSNPIYSRDAISEGAFKEVMRPLVNLESLTRGPGALNADMGFGYQTSYQIVPLHERKTIYE
jgi:chromosome segregation ATPase